MLAATTAISSLWWQQAPGAVQQPRAGWPSQQILSGPIITTGVWYHVAFTYDQSAMKLYCNGQPVATNVIGAQAIAASSSNLRISGDDDLHAYFDGLIDEPSVYNRALSDAEIAAIYNAGSAGKCRGLAPSILHNRQARLRLRGPTSLYRGCAGTPPLSYQWQFNGTRYCRGDRHLAHLEQRPAGPGGQLRGGGQRTPTARRPVPMQC